MLELYLNVLEARERLAQARLHQANDIEVHDASRRRRVFDLRRAEADLARAER